MKTPERRLIFKRKLIELEWCFYGAKTIIQIRKLSQLGHKYIQNYFF